MPRGHTSKKSPPPSQNNRESHTYVASSGRFRLLCFSFRRDRIVIALGWMIVLAPVALLGYAYIVYPAALAIIAQGRRHPTHPLGALPPVSVVIPAYNEEVQIRGAIDAVLAQDYPPDRLQLLILSDASTDQTDHNVREYGTKGVELLRMPVRGGKTAAENASCAHLRGEIIINTDASIRLHPAAVRRLVEGMGNPRVGVASTRDVSVAREVEATNTAEAGYVGYEMGIRALETACGGIVGASGSGYAIRATLHRIPIRADLSRDFSAALTARRHGYVAISVDEALCFVPRTASLRTEYRRKVRTIARGMETLLYHRQLLDPMQFGLFAWKLMSHKVCRWMAPPAGVVGVVGLIILAQGDVWARALLLGVAAASALAAAGAMWPVSRPLPRALSLVTFGVAANIAVVHAIIRVAFGTEDHVWEPTRRTPLSVEDGKHQDRATPQR